MKMIIDYVSYVHYFLKNFPPVLLWLCPFPEKLVSFFSWFLGELIGEFIGEHLAVEWIPWGSVPAIGFKAGTEMCCPSFFKKWVGFFVYAGNFRPLLLFLFGGVKQIFSELFFETKNFGAPPFFFYKFEAPSANNAPEAASLAPKLWWMKSVLGFGFNSFRSCLWRL